MKRAAARAGGCSRMKQVEKMAAGFKVIAGPFDVQSKDLGLRRREISEALRAKQHQLDAGVPAKVLLLKDGAWVLRSVEGWKEEEGGGRRGRVSDLSKPEPQLACPACGIKMRAVQGLRIHQCKALPLVTVCGITRHQRLTAEQVAEAVATAKAAGHTVVYRSHHAPIYLKGKGAEA